MFRTITSTLLAIAILPLLSCASKTAPPKQTPRLRVLCSTFPMYLFTLNVTQGCDGIEVGPMLPPSAGCPHDYALTPDDMRKIASADVLVVNGLGLEEFLGQPIKSANPKIRIVDSSAGLGGLIAMEKEEGHEHGHAHEHGDHNPHLFASPHRAAQVVRNIAAGLAKADPVCAEQFRRNGDAYAARLETVADEFVAAVRSLRSTKIVTQHAVFDYLAADAGLTIAAVIEETPGEDPATSGGKLADLIKAIKASGATAIFTEPQYPADVARTVARDARLPAPASLDPVASGPANPPLDYYETTMRANIATIAKALSGAAP